MEAVPQETVEKLMGNVPAQKELEGIRILASSPGSVRYEIDVPDNVLNYHGCIHGGFVSTMLEIAAGMATYAYGESNVAVSCATNFVRAVRPQRLTVTPTPRTRAAARRWRTAPSSTSAAGSWPSPHSRCSSWGRSRASASCTERLRLPAEAS